MHAERSETDGLNFVCLVPFLVSFQQRIVCLACNSVKIKPRARLVPTPTPASGTGTTMSYIQSIARVGIDDPGPSKLKKKGGAAGQQRKNTLYSYEEDGEKRVETTGLEVNRLLARHAKTRSRAEIFQNLA